MKFHFPTRKLLWLDCLGALLGGIVMITLSDWLAPLYGMSLELYWILVAGEFCYGLFSLTLALRSRKPRLQLSILIFANAFWGNACLAAAGFFVRELTFFGIAHLILEGVYLAWLAGMEWKHRETLLRAS